MFFRTILICTWMIFLLVPLYAQAAEDDMRLTDLDVMDFGLYDGRGSENVDDPVCVYREESTTRNRYRVTATDDSTLTPGAFHLENQVRTVEIPYQVRWRSKPNPGGKVMVYGVPLNRSNANLQDELCAIGGLSANLRIRLLRADLEAAPGGQYSAEVRITVEAR